MAIKVLAPGYYAQPRHAHADAIAVGVLVLTQVLNLVLVPRAAARGARRSTIGIGALVNAVWLLIGLIRRGSYKPEPGWGSFVLQVLVGTAVLAASPDVGRAAFRLDRPARRSGCSASGCWRR